MCRDQRPVHNLSLELAEDATIKTGTGQCRGRETSLALYKPAAPGLSARCAVGVCTTPQWPMELFPETFVTFFTSLDHKNNTGLPQKKARTYRKVKAANSSDRTVFLYPESRFSSITYYNHILCKRKKVLKSVWLCGNLFFRLSVQLLGAGWGAQRAKRLQHDLTTWAQLPNGDIKTGDSLSSDLHTCAGVREHPHTQICISTK